MIYILLSTNMFKQKINTWENGNWSFYFESILLEFYWIIATWLNTANFKILTFNILFSTNLFEIKSNIFGKNGNWSFHFDSI